MSFLFATCSYGMIVILATHEQAFLSFKSLFDKLYGGLQWPHLAYFLSPQPRIVNACLAFLVIPLLIIVPSAYLSPPLLPLALFSLVLAYCSPYIAFRSLTILVYLIVVNCCYSFLFTAYFLSTLAYLGFPSKPFCLSPLRFSLLQLFK